MQRRIDHNVCGQSNMIVHLAFRNLYSITAPDSNACKLDVTDGLGPAPPVYWLLTESTNHPHCLHYIAAAECKHMVQTAPIINIRLLLNKRSQSCQSSASNCLERLVSEISSGTLNSSHSLISVSHYKVTPLQK